MATMDEIKEAMESGKYKTITEAVKALRNKDEGFTYKGSVPEWLSLGYTQYK